MFLALLGLAKAAAVVVFTPVGKVVGCAAGVAVWIDLWLFMLAKKRRKRLSHRVKRIMAEFFPQVNMEKVRIRTNTWLPGKADGMTLNYNIYFRGDFHECAVREVTADATVVTLKKADLFTYNMALLFHEMVHVQQYQELGWFWFACEYGTGVASEAEPVWAEVDASGRTAANRELLLERVKEECAETAATARRRSNWFWLTWGST